MAREQNLELPHGANATLGAEAETGAKRRVVGGSGQQVRIGSRQQVATESEFIGAMAVGQEAVVANALKTGGQGGLQEKSDELLGGHGHHLADGIPVVGPGKGDLAVLEGQQALVADGDAVGIAAEILQHASGTAEGRFGVNHPFLVFQWGQELGEGAGIAQRFDLSEKLQGAIGVSLHQSLQDQVAEASGENFDRQKKSAGCGDPTLVVRSETATGNDAVKVRMEVQVLAPAMEDAEETEFYSQTFGGGGEEGLSGGVKEDSVDGFFVVEGEGGDLFGEGEDYVEVFGRQQFGATIFQPKLARRSLALGAVRPRGYPGGRSDTECG